MLLLCATVYIFKLLKTELYLKKNKNKNKNKNLCDTADFQATWPLWGSTK